MTPTRTLSAPARFFWKHAGYCYALNESQEEGRTRCAESLASAEGVLIEAMRADVVRIEWPTDPTGWEDFRADKRAGHIDEATPAPEVIEGCTIKTHTGDHLASLWGIWDATPEYRRVVRAELALGCLDDLRALVVKDRAGRRRDYQQLVLPAVLPERTEANTHEARW